MGEFLDEFVERHKNIGPVAIAEKELVVKLVLLQLHCFLFHGEKIKSVCIKDLHWYAKHLYMRSLVYF